jgi:hypothetical protein
VQYSEEYEPVFSNGIEDSMGKSMNGGTPNCLIYARKSCWVKAHPVEGLIEFTLESDIKVL